MSVAFQKKQLVLFYPEKGNINDIVFGVDFDA